MKTNNQQLKLKNQLCFPLYSVNKSIIKSYSILLEPLDLTYTQYLVMMVLWEEHQITMKHLEDRLNLESNTLSPLVNRLVDKKYISKFKSKNDKRKIIVKLEPKGLELIEIARNIPKRLYEIVNLPINEVTILCDLLSKVEINLLKFQDEQINKMVKEKI